MPSTDVKATEPAVLKQKLLTEAASRTTDRTAGKSKAEIVKKMPCSPYEKCGETIPQAPPPSNLKMDGPAVPPPEKNGVIHVNEGATHNDSTDTDQPIKDGATTEQAGESEVAGSDTTKEETEAEVNATEEPGDQSGGPASSEHKLEPGSEKQEETGCDATSFNAKPQPQPQPQMKGDATIIPDAKPEPKTDPEKPKETEGASTATPSPEHVAQTNAKPKRAKPASFSLLDMEYRDPEGNGRGWLVPQRTLSASSQPHGPRSLCHTVSAPAALSSLREASPDDAVFSEGGGAGTIQPADGSTVVGRQSEQQTEQREPIKAENGSSSDKAGSDRDISELIGGIEKGLKLEAERDKREGSTADEVGSLAKDFERGMRLGERAREKQCQRVSIEGLEPSRLRAKGINQLGDGGQAGPGVFASQTQWMQQQQQQQQQLLQQHQWMPPQQLMSQPEQPLPSFQCFFRRPQPGVFTQGQPTQSVVSPPGQGFLDSRSPMVRIRPAIQSRQIQYAQQNLFLDAQPPMQPQGYMLNGPVGMQVMGQAQMTTPSESTGSPSEMDWPPTPESDVSEVDNLLEIMNEDLAGAGTSDGSGGQLEAALMELAGVPSPQSPWSQAASNASASPVASPYADPNLSPSPDTYNPLSPDSNVSSPYMQPSSPEHAASKFIHVPGTMSSGRVTVGGGRLSASKRPRNDSLVSTDSEEAKEDITRIKNFLKAKPDASPLRGPGFWPSSPPQPEPPSHRAACTPPYVATPPPYVATPPPYVATPPPVHNPPQHTPTPFVSRDQRFREGELQAYQRKVANLTVEHLMTPDEDKDNALHLAICHMKVPLATAIIQRVYDLGEKRRLNDTNLEGQTPLFLAALSNLPLLTQFLINKEADPTIGNFSGNTPLHIAAMYGNTEAIHAIIEGLRYSYPPNYAYKLFNTRNYDGKTPLILAVENHGNYNIDRNIVDCTETVRLLLRSHASALVQDSNSGKTALHYAMELPKLDMMEVLLECCDDAGQLTNCPMYDGNTALHLIVGRSLPEEQILEVVGRLMTHGANVGLENIAKEKPQNLVLCEHTEVKRRLHGQGNRRR